jgi:GntR family transcriptional regulator / MocR family aminotransferase
MIRSSSNRSMRTTSPEALIELDRSRPRGLRAQVEDELRAAIRSGRLRPGTRLPASRALASDLGVTRGVVVAAYDQLIAEGYLVARTGSGTVINCLPDTATPAPPRPAGPAFPVVDFRPGLPDLDLFPRTAWLRAMRTALHTMPGPDLGYIDPRGLRGVREILVDYLARVRGVSTDPDHVVVCNGFGHGLSLVTRVLLDAGLRDIAIEDPGQPEPRARLESIGARLHSIEVDRDGIVVSALRSTGARAVVVTPAHQFPSGVVMSPARRTELVAWAREVDGYIIEDDYDAEYRYDRHPVGAVQGVAPERVVYSGTLSKCLAPGLRLGWLVLPPKLVEPVTAERALTDLATASIEQSALGAFLASGDLDRHLRRTRRIYRQRRDWLIDALARHLPSATPGGVAAGLHVLVTLPAGCDEHDVAERAAAEGVGVYPFSAYRIRQRESDEPALVLGYSCLTADRADAGVAVLSQVVSGT